MNKFFKFLQYEMQNTIEENKIQKAKAKRRHKKFIDKIEEQHKRMEKNKIDINKWR